MLHPKAEPLYLDLADFLLIAEAILGVPAEALARSEHIIARAESALSAPAASYMGEEFYPEFAQKAAILCSRIARNHPLPDGNKRTGFLCLVEFIERNGFVWMPPGGDDETVEMIVCLAASELTEQDFVVWVQDRIGRSD